MADVSLIRMITRVRYVKIVPDGGVKLSDIRFLVRHYPRMNHFVS